MCQVTFINYWEQQQSRRKQASLLIQLQEGLNMDGEQTWGHFVEIVWDEEEEGDDNNDDARTNVWTESGKTAAMAISDADESRECNIQI